MRLVIALCAIVLPVFGGSFSSKERARLSSHLELSESWLKDEVAGLSKEQLNYHSAPDIWSIAEVLEHLAVAEPQYWKAIEDAIKSPAVDKKSTFNDVEWFWYGVDRTQRDKTGAAREPHGQIGDPKKSLESFVALRAKILKYVQTTDDDVRSHFVKDSPQDVFQGILMISTHAQRHILQIREVKHSSGFPKGN